MKAYRLALLPALALLVPAGAAGGDAELNKPYELQIVLHVGQHPWLTDVFRDRVGRELRDSLQAALGDLARVSVVIHHPRLKDVVERGLDRALDGWAERSGIKTHFVLVDFVGTHYEIQARQHDGLTGRPSRVVRRDRTRDRDFVAKAAALLVEHDFGMVGTIAGPPDGQEVVSVELKAGALGPLTRWVPRGKVFEIIPPGGTAALPWALLQVVEPPSEDTKDGVCKCKFWHRYRVGSVEHFQCVMLGTTRSALRLRFVQEQARGVQRPLDGRSLGVDFRHYGFDGEEATKLHKSTDLNGWVDTIGDRDKGVFEDIAFVSVTNNLSPLPQVPVAVMDDRPVIIPVTLNAEPGSLFDARRKTWERNVTDSLLVQVSLFNEVHALGAKAEGRAKALERAKAGLDRSREDYNSLTAQRDDLAKEAAKAHVEFRPTREDQRLKDLREGEKLLAKYVGEQEAINNSGIDDKFKRWRSEVERAKLLVKDKFEVGEAIAIYKKVLEEGLDSKEVADELKRLEKLWRPAGMKHRKARTFIFQKWPAITDAAGIKAHLKEARDAFEDCKQVNDVLGPQKLLKACVEHAEQLRKELSELNPLVIDDEKPARLIEAVSTDLAKLADDIQAYLETKADDADK
jgi:hypothetical protein